MSENNLYSPISLKKAVEYSPNSIVSKTIVENDGGVITLFAFDAGQNLSEHTAPFDSVAIIIEGRADIFIDGKLNSLSEGEMIIMPADIPHAIKCSERFKMLLVMIQK